ncbi:stress protein DDR48-like [Limulus polyphemus]|uniref:Stress protein DDR48-like n=1 Tax=Limulus polyphemus TaxID=6850 RepID=A0ABM1B8M1_LIMPO|nr:stress protein DDR48-like [Limulus polyphemus]
MWEQLVFCTEDLNKRPNTSSDSFGSTSSGDYDRYPYDKYDDRRTKNNTYGSSYGDSSSGKYPYDNHYTSSGKYPYDNHYNDPYSSSYGYGGGYGDQYDDYRNRYNSLYHSRYGSDNRYYGNGNVHYLNEPKYPPYWYNRYDERSDRYRYSPSYYSGLRERPDNRYNGNGYSLYLNEPRGPPYRYYDTPKRNYPYDLKHAYRSHPEDHRVYYNIETGEFRVSDDDQYSAPNRPDYSPSGFHESRYEDYRNSLGSGAAYPPLYHGYNDFRPGFRRGYIKEESSADVLTGKE